MESAAQGGGLPTPGQGESVRALDAFAGPGGAVEELRSAAGRVLGRCGPLGAAIRAMRPLHWAKNLLVFVPLFEGHHTDLASELRPTILTFVAFCLCASSAYVVNDLADLRQDRCHPRKRHRPIATGELGPDAALLLAALLAALGFGVAAVAPRSVTLVLGAYWLGTLAYTLVFRQIVVLDVVCLAGFFTLRLFAGALAAAEELVPWLFAVASFAFLSLAYLKRTIELRVRCDCDQRALHVYAAPDLWLLGLAGKTSACLAIVASALFVSSHYAGEIYAIPERLYLVIPLAAFWLARIWWLADRGRVDEDPVVFVVGDRVSYAVGLAAGAIAWLSL